MDRDHINRAVIIDMVAARLGTINQRNSWLELNQIAQRRPRRGNEITRGTLDFHVHLTGDGTQVGKRPLEV